MPNEIDPIEYGKLLSDVEQLKKTVDKMASQIDTLVALVNQGRGAFWLAIFVGGSISSVVTFVATKMQLFAGFR
jgi:hypothetical protein